MRWIHRLLNTSQTAPCHYENACPLERHNYHIPNTEPLFPSASIFNAVLVLVKFNPALVALFLSLFLHHYLSLPLLLSPSPLLFRLSPSVCPSLSSSLPLNHAFPCVWYMHMPTAQVEALFGLLFTGTRKGTFCLCLNEHLHPTLLFFCHGSFHSSK